jgi:hypothetical protein
MIIKFKIIAAIFWVGDILSGDILGRRYFGLLRSQNCLPRSRNVLLLSPSSPLFHEEPLPAEVGGRALAATKTKSIYFLLFSAARRITTAELRMEGMVSGCVKKPPSAPIFTIVEGVDADRGREMGSEEKGRRTRTVFPPPQSPDSLTNRGPRNRISPFSLLRHLRRRRCDLRCRWVGWIKRDWKLDMRRKMGKEEDEELTQILLLLMMSRQRWAFPIPITFFCAAPSSFAPSSFASSSSGLLPSPPQRGSSSRTAATAGNCGGGGWNMEEAEDETKVKNEKKMKERKNLRTIKSC